MRGSDPAALAVFKKYGAKMMNIIKVLFGEANFSLEIFLQQSYLVKAI